MKLTIRNAITFGGLAGAKVIAGRDRLDNPINSISVLEVAESKIAHWVIQNELYITSFYAIKEDVEMQKVVIRALANSGCCGLVICHIDMWIKEMEPQVVALCNELHFPLIIAKSERSYVDILNPIIETLMKDKDHEEGQRTDSYSNIRNDFLELIVNEDDIYEVFHNISKKLKRGISYYDIYYTCIYSNKSHEKVNEEIAYIKENFSSISSQCAQDRYALWQSKDGLRLIYLIKSQKSFFGFIVVECWENRATKEILEMMDHLCVTCTLLFSRKDKLVGIKERYLQDYIGDLLVWNFRSAEVAVSRGQEVGLNILSKNNAMVVNVNSIQQAASQDKAREMERYVKKYVLPNIRELILFYNKSNIVIWRSDTIIILLENESDTLDLRRIGENIVELFKLNEKLSVSVGISDSFTSIADIPIAYNQAFQAAILGREYYGENWVSTYLDVWFYHKLRNMKEDAASVQMCHRLIAPLVHYDTLHQSSLVETLYCLITNNMDAGLVSKELYLHRNTLLHRKNKIIELLGYSPFEMPHLINFIFAFGIIGKP